MDRDRNAPAAGARPNTRPTSQLFVKQEGRKPLFTGAATNTATNTSDGAKDDASAATKPRAGLFNRRTNSESQAASTTPATRRGSSSSVGSSGSTRIPRPATASFLHRRPISLTEAYRLAEEEEKAESDHPGNASPSPAPRPWRSRQGSDEVKMREMLSEDHLDTKKGDGPSLRRPSALLVGNREQEQGPRRNAGSPTKTESKPSADARPPTSRAGEPETTPRERLTDWRSRVRPSSGLFPLRGTTPKDFDGGSLPALVPGIEDVPLPSIEPPVRSYEPPVSPEKSFAWQVDQDFTAGDLTVSDSPRIRFGYQPATGRPVSTDEKEVVVRTRSPLKSTLTSRNTKLDEIRAREMDSGINGQGASPWSRQKNTKLDEIRTRELEAESQIPIPDRNQARPKNTKLDEIRQRELDGLSKRTLASVRLEEIRERNSMSRSLSPDEEMRPRSSREAVAEAGGNFELEPIPPLRLKSAFEIGGERIPDTPVTIYKGRRSRESIEKEEGKGEEGGKGAVSGGPGEGDKAGDHRDILRRLARAASASPAPEPEAQKPPIPPRADRPADNRAASDGIASARTRWRNRHDRLNADNVGRSSNPEAKEAEPSKPTVEFAGLRRVRSTESTKSKRSSVHSEGDPVDRIDSEMKLFAPGENHSERGSIRAPSPKSDEDEDEGDKKKEDDEDEPEATPRPRKQDFLSMPTPKVTGAYVETPATVKVEDRFVVKDEPDVRDKKQPSIEPAALLRERKPSSTDLTATLRERKPSNTDLTATLCERKPSSTDLTATLRERKPSSTDLTATLRERKPSSTDLAATLREKRRSSARRTRLSDTASDPGSEDKDAAVTTSAAVRKPRARSLPRRRPLLRNTAKPHTVRDDLLELQRAHNIDDSTLEDLEGLLFGRKRNSSVPKPEDLLKDLSESETTDQKDLELKTDSETDQKPTSITNLKKGAPEKEFSGGELAAYDRMSKSLRTGLLGIRTAKQGIERLEDQVSHSQSQTEKKPAIETMEEHLPTHKHRDCATCAATARFDSQYAWSYVYLPVPRLYHTSPRFRLTLFGLLMVLLSLWFTAETTMCTLYCRPTTCSSEPCIWSFDDPSFGNAIPVKLDQWTTGGRGRVAFDAFLEHAQDRTADVLDELLGRDITHPDYARGMSFAQRRQHRRRLQAKGLLRARPEPSAEDRAKWDAWERAMKADERAAAAREMGYVLETADGDATIGGDIRVG